MSKKDFQDNTRYATYHTRIDVSPTSFNFLDDTSKYLSMLERRLYADYRKDKSIMKLKNDYLARYNISARHFNSLRINLQGKIESCLRLQGDYIADTKSRIKKLKQSIKFLKKLKSKTLKQAFSLHHKQRSLVRLTKKLERLISDKKNKKARICFGSKRLFKKQFNLRENDYESHSEWLKDWQDKRDSQFYLVGSKDETSGNQSCIASINDDESINFKIKVPAFLVPTHGPFVTIDNINFEYGHDRILESIAWNNKRSSLSKAKAIKLHGDLYKQYGQAINYRFLKDTKGWRVFISVALKSPKVCSDKKLGCIGVDINVNHLAVSEIDRTGNLVNCFNIPCNLYGKDTNQTKAIVGDTVKTLVEYAKLKNKPIVIEKLDFQEKKRALMGQTAATYLGEKRKGCKAKKARSLSSFAYSLIINTIKSKAFRNGIEVHEVNPAYSSVIGRVKFASIYSKLSVHTSAALVIARRFLGFSERLPKFLENIPDNKGGHLTLSTAREDCGRHVWHTWAKVKKELQTVLAAQYQMMRQCSELISRSISLPGTLSLELEMDSDIPF